MNDHARATNSRTPVRKTIAMRLVALCCAASSLVVGACRQPEQHTEELFQAQSLGVGYLDRGQLPEAEAQFKKVVSLAPKEPLGHANLGLTYLRWSRYRDAEEQLSRARELDPTNADIALMAARLYAATGRTAEAARTLEQARRAAPTNPHVLYAVAELDRQNMASDPAGAARYEKRLREVLTLAPMNLAVHLELIDALVRGREADSAVHRIEEVRRTGPEIPKEAQPALDTTVRLLQSGKVAEAREPLDRFLHVMRVTSPYQASLDDVKWLEGPIAGRPVLTFTPKTLSTLRGGGVARRNASENLVQFVDVTTDAGLPSPSASPAAGAATPPIGGAIATGDYDGDGTDDLFASFSSPEERGVVTRLYHVRAGQLADVTQRSGIALPGGAVFATFADVDNDGRQDLFVIGGDQHGHLFHNNGNGTFQDVTAKAGLANIGGARKGLFVDLDHDGDLDLVLVGGGRLQLFRNNLDGTFTETAQALGLTGAGPATAVTQDAAFADFDGDGRTDLLVINKTGQGALYRNDGGGHFTDVIAKSGLSFNGGSAVAVGDYNNDGFIDVFVAGSNGGEASLWLNNGDGTFRRDRASAAALPVIRASGGAVADAKFLDYDNDGWLDLIVSGSALKGGRGMVLLHNSGNGTFTDRSNLFPAELGVAVAPDDVDGDGDLDLFVADAGGVRLFRNDGGNANLSMQVQLDALRTGSGKNNTFGIGSKVEVRSAELYQTRIVTSRVTHFGLGPHLKADVVRVQWTNGVPETVYFPGTDQDVIENEVLKGSCAFLYAWDGTRYRFVTDVMWRSALGMPLGLMAGGGTGGRPGTTMAYAPAGASQEYLRIPGDALRPRDGKYTLQLTEELWETAYADQIKLLAVDHPDSVDVFVDERFVPPGPVQLRLFQIARRHPPQSAVDDRGNDVLPALLEQDDDYVSNLTPTRYQGLVEPHDLILDLGADAGADSTFLFLRGWIYPTDASINVALSQQSGLAPTSPALAVRDARGQWKTVMPNLGFPSGKSKTMVIGLSGIFPTSDHHVRIRTNLQIYWDQALVARDIASGPEDEEASAARIRPLVMTSADLHVRGYSRTYRKGGRYGPWWFDYDSVSTSSRWRPITGAFTRFGDVRPLLGASDDMYVILAPGDEATLQFDAASADSVPHGWKRDFLLYTDGWIKDSDLNTAFGTTVEPLPFHAIRSYPYAPGESYPTDSVHQRYRREYNTRAILAAPR